MNTMNELSRKVREITGAKDIAERIKAVDWKRISDNLDAHGSAIIENLVAPEECEALAGLYPRDEIFRSRVVMARHGFGRGEYKYFSYPLPRIISDLRTSMYPKLAPIANRWNRAMGIDVRFPQTTRISSNAAMRPASLVPPRCCCNTSRVTTIACIRTCTVNMCFRFSSLYCYRSRGGISRGVNLY